MGSSAHTSPPAAIPNAASRPQRTALGAEAVVRPALVVIAATGLALGFAARPAGLGHLSSPIWAAATIPVLIALVAEIAVSLRRGNVGLDIVAALSMSMALLFGENLAAAVVALMYAGGQYLESYAERRASREMTALLSRVPRTAIRYNGDRLQEVALDAIAPGDLLLIRRWDTVPVDGTVASGVAVLDESALTGESLPVQRKAGAPVMSGVINAADAFDLNATHRAAESTFAGIVRLVEAARRSKAPLARLADRFALLFLAVTSVLAGGAWAFTGDPIRALAVLVVATPCPLILAVPVAIVSGVSRAARWGVLVKGGAALEALGRVRGLVLDKTGTLTHGEARLMAIRPAAGFVADQVLRLAASLDQASKHVIARALLKAAEERGLPLATPTDVSETPGEGLEGRVDGLRVVVGGESFVSARLGLTGPGDGESEGAVTVAVGIEGRLAGLLIFRDPVRAEAAGLLEALRRAGIGRIVLATGDRRAVADELAASIPFDAVHAELSPEDKLAVVAAERRSGPVMMVGDGVNDAPALAAADVGLAMGAHGAAVSADAADAVLLVDRLDRVLIAVQAARRSRRIALQSVYVGIGLSVAGMIIAAFGYLTPVQGAVIQEIIDVAVILNALRALGGEDPERELAVPPWRASAAG